MLNFNGFFSDDRYEYTFGIMNISDNYGKICDDLIHILIFDNTTDESLSFSLLDDIDIGVDANNDEIVIDKNCAVYDQLVKLAYENIIYKSKRVPVVNPTIMGDDSQNTLKVTKLGDEKVSFKINKVDNNESRIMLINTFYKVKECDCDKRNSDYKRRAKTVILEMFDVLKHKNNEAIMTQEADEPII